MPYFPVTPVLVPITVTSKWTDIDLNLYATLPSAGVTGVALQVVANNAVFGCRAKGSTIAIKSTSNPARMFGAWCGVDVNDAFQIYASSKTAIKVYVVGYMTAGFTFLAAEINVSADTYDAWADVDCTTHVPTTAIALIFIVKSISSGSDLLFGIRDDGSTDDLKAEIRGGSCHLAVMKCTDRKCEQYADSGYVGLYLIGYIEGESLGTFLRDKATNDYSLAGVSAYTDLTALPVGAKVGLFEVMDDGTATAYSYALRKNGGAIDEYHDSQHCFISVEADANGIVEGKIENLITNFYLVGWFAGNAQTPHCNVGMGDYQVI
jgi:hypothetical protein